MGSASGRLPDSTPSHIGSLRTEGADVNWRKASAINVHALAVKPIITGLAMKQHCKL